MKTQQSERIEEALNELEDTDALEDAIAGSVSLGDDESYLPFSNGFDMAEAWFAAGRPTIFAADHLDSHSRIFFFGKDEDEILAKIAAARG